jgi:acyl-CoA thioester hydrolase
MPLPTDRLIHETRFWVRYAETDRMGIVHHATYVIYFEEARNQFSRDMGASYADFEKEGIALVVSEANLRYLAPAVFGQEVVTKTWIDDLKSRRITFGYQVENPENGEVHCTGTVKLICVTPEGQVQRIPQQWLESWGRALETK